MNSKKYLSSIGIENKIETLSDIELLIKSHISTFAFSSISVLLKKELSLDLSDILQRFIDKKAGGYCFEHNKIMYETLKSHGFEVKSIFGRVLNNRKDITPPKTHRFNLLKYRGEEYIIDVGFGYMSPSKPIKFGNTPTKATLDKSYIIKNINNSSYELQIITENAPYILYSFDLQNYNEIDFEVGHFYSHKHPEAVFVNNLVLSLIKENEILSLRNNSFQKLSKDKKEELIIDSVDKFKYILESDFNYSLNEDDADFLYKNFVEKLTRD
ncbi:MAG: arylamine N-acetyltransferase [Sulfurimonas sp.]|uniref:arylamine N-acetyltransferase family protein n=1 Tax=Sulfurimonas sp. TaxID=2022749 RepID=UPI0025D8E3A8|nr:arylamine N-acetyltransferase [Sulfurimonas sp.]MCK9454038.1 arylamine N-acetyltransferase [Sulfurimonas sp.]